MWATGPARPLGRARRLLLDHRVRGRDQAGHLDLFAIDHRGHLRRDLVLPVVALVDGVVEPLALSLALEAPDPDVDALVLLAHEAAEDDHAHLDLEWDDLLFHALDPVVALPRTEVILPKLEEHAKPPLARAPRRPPGAGSIADLPSPCEGALTPVCHHRAREP